MICPRCNHEIAEGESHDQGPAPDFIRTHRPQRCFDLLNTLQGDPAKTKDLVTQIDTLTATVKRDAETIKELTAQVEARDEEMTKAAYEAEDDEPTGKKKK